MDNAELYGKVLHCNIAKPMPAAERGKALWTSEEWLSEQQEQQGAEDEEVDISDTIDYGSITK
jgi:hypothetical protein